MKQTNVQRDTPGSLFENVLHLIKESGHFAEAEEIIDYTLPCCDRRQLTNYAFDFEAIVLPGSNEGIYISCYLSGKFDGSGDNRCYAGTIKTLCEKVDAYRIMGALAGYLAYYSRKYVNDNIERFEPEKQKED